MLVVESPHPPGVVGMVGGELARYHAFTMCLVGLNVPFGTKGYGGLGYDVSYNRNSVIQFALNNSEMQWLQLWDDDHVFAPDITLKLLNHHTDVVVPVYAQRTPPYSPCLYKEEREDGSFAIHDWADFEGKDGLLPVTSAGGGGLLIRRHVLEKISAPWFERQGKIGEDHLFYKKCRAAGFQPYAALDCQLGHLTTVEVWPHHNDRNEWCAQVELKGSGSPHIIEFWNEKYRT